VAQLSASVVTGFDELLAEQISNHTKSFFRAKFACIYKISQAYQPPRHPFKVPTHIPTKFNANFSKSTSSLKTYFSLWTKTQAVAHETSDPNKQALTVLAQPADLPTPTIND